MANRDRPARQPVGAAAAVVPVLDAARVLMLYGAVGVVVGTTGSRSPPGDATPAFGGLILWLLGVCLLAFMPAAGRFPRAVAAAALGHLLTPWN